MHRLFYIILIAVIPFSAISQVITTYAGRGIGMGGFSGDGGPATAAHIGGLGEGVFDASGNYYFPIRGGNRVRKISVLGIITTVAGTGASGYSGDGVAATGAPSNFWVDAIIVANIPVDTTVGGTGIFASLSQGALYTDVPLGSGFKASAVYVK